MMMIFRALLNNIICISKKGGIIIKGTVQTTLLAIGRVVILLVAVPLGLPSGASAVQATQLYSGAQMWLLVLVCVGVIFVIGLLGKIATALETLDESIEQLREQLTTHQEDAKHEEIDG
jgi:hypothetical protein